MGLLKSLARGIHRILPAGGLKNQLSALAYRIFYASSLEAYTFSQGVFEARFKNGQVLKSCREFDPEPLVGYLETLQLEPGSVAMDLGGHYGMVAISLAQRVGTQGRVIVYEADPANYQVLTENIRLNGISNILAYNKGVYDHADKLEFFSGGGYTSSFQKTDYVEKQTDSYQKIQVEVVPLDAERKNWAINRLDFVKMDIEGSEVRAVSGAKELLKRFHPDLMIETHIVDGKSTFSGLKEELTGLGYDEIRLEADERSNPIVFARIIKTSN